MPTLSATNVVTVKSMAGVQVPNNDPATVVLPNAGRFSQGKAIIVEVAPNIFVANKIGSQRFHKFVPQFTHILVREDGSFASGHDPAKSIKLNMKNQSKDMPWSWVTLDPGQDFFQANAREANGTVHNPGLHRALQICAAATANLPVLVTCGSAVSRTPSFMMIYFIYRHDVTYSDVTGWIIAISTAVPEFKPFPAPGFLAQIHHHEPTLHNWHAADGL